mmetsp:Transcript_36302/g.41357  ORF Transcript_36302/g.41357 Transcript_36302/m.41357 type:complete len:149 (+) Transcript_36302:544-990(+)
MIGLPNKRAFRNISIYQQAGEWQDNRFSSLMRCSFEKNQTERSFELVFSLEVFPYFMNRSGMDMPESDVNFLLQRTLMEKVWKQNEFEKRTSVRPTKLKLVSTKLGESGNDLAKIDLVWRWPIQFKGPMFVIAEKDSFLRLSHFNSLK